MAEEASGHDPAALFGWTVVDAGRALFIALDVLSNPRPTRGRPHGDPDIIGRRDSGLIETVHGYVVETSRSQN